MSNSIWKTPDQKPDKNEPIIIRNLVGVLYSIPCMPFPTMREDRTWAYLHEVVAQADKAERLQKRLDVIFNIMDKSRCQDVFAISNNAAWDVWGTAKGLKTDNEIKQLIKE